jgi:hypothetical protein
VKKNSSANVYIRFPKAGLGNMMLVWAKGIVFAHLNNLPFITSSWWGLHWGALLRNERKRRIYSGYFVESPVVKRLGAMAKCFLFNVKNEPHVTILSEEEKQGNTIFLFNKVSTDTDLFGPIRSHRNLLITSLFEALSPKMKKILLTCEKPVIGVHIRRGDFKLGNQTTPLDYFIKGIDIIRNTAGTTLPVTIFTDANEKELAGLLLLPLVSIAQDKPDILDILLLSKSKVMILSKSSTFSYWAAFLSSATVVRPHDDWQELIRYDDIREGYLEIKWNYKSSSSTQKFMDKISTLNV